MSKIHIDTDKCQGHGRCYMSSPSLFDSDDDGFAIVLVEDVGPEQQRDAARAVLGCPEQAVALI